MVMSLKVVVPPHPLISHWLTVLRSSETPPALYATGLEELGKWLTYEAIREWLPQRKEKVITQQGSAEGTVIESSVPLISLPLLPGGLHLWNGARTVLPNTQICLQGIPEKIRSNEGVIIFIDQIADGERILEVLIKLEEQKVEAKRIRLITALAATPGLKILAERFPAITIHCACIDPDLSTNGCIIPGIGDPVLRLNSRTTDPD